MKPTAVALTSVGAEYVAMPKACTMIIQYRHLLNPIYQTQGEATTTFEDHTGAISTSVNSKVTPRTKHIDIKYHHVRSPFEDKVVEVDIESSLTRKKLKFSQRACVR